MIYGGWFSLMLGWQTLGRLPATLLLIGFTAWYMSLQHELIHGHPTRWPQVNQLFDTLPLAVWFPYGLYRDSHLAHHRNHTLTEPDEDPETWYFSAARWAQLPRYVPDALRGLHIIGKTPAAPGLPLITAASTSVARLERLRAALHQLVDDTAWRSACDDNLIGGFSPVQRDDYQGVLAWKRQAAALGIVRL